MNYFLRPTRCRRLTRLPAGRIRLPAACAASGGGYPLLSRWFSAQKQNIDSFSSLPACQSHNSSFPHMIFQASFGTEAIILCILVHKNYSELFFSITFLRIPVFHGREFLIFMLLYLLSPNPALVFSFPGSLVPLPGMYILTKPASVPKHRLDLNPSVPERHPSRRIVIYKQIIPTCNPPSPNL